MLAFNCPECEFTSDRKSLLLQHQRSANHWRRYRCDTCGALFTRKTNLDRHVENHNNANSFHCNECGRSFSRPDALQRYLIEKHQRGFGEKRPRDDTEDNHVVKKLRKKDESRQFYNITKIKEQRMVMFRTTSTSYKVTFNDIEVTEDVMSALKRFFASIILDLTRGSTPKDLVRMTAQSPSLDYPIVIPFMKIPELTVDRFMAEIERVLQSNEDFVIDESLIFEVTLVDMPTRGTRKRCKFINTDKFLENKKCILRIQNDDDLCCARAIVTAKARLDKHDKWESIRKSGKIQEQMAKELHQLADVPLQRCGLDEMKKLQVVLNDYQVHIISQEHFNGIIYAGPEAANKIYLYFHDGHYDIITSMSAFLSRNYFCTNCNKGYDHKEDHKCNNVCHACRKVHEEAYADWTQCDSCNRYFKGQACFSLHKKLTAKGNSTCIVIYRCTKCDKTVNKHLDKNHKCGQTYCIVCQDFYPENHQCCMMPEEENLLLQEEDLEEEEGKTYIYFDFECTQDDLVECEKGYVPDLYGKCVHCMKSSCGSYEHKPNLCVAQKVCTLCMNEDECEICGQREHVFSGENTLNEFCQWLFSEDNYQATVLCHNFQGYDSYPILQYLYDHGVLPTIIPNGAKIMCLKVPSCKIRMIDFINFLPMALAKLPSMFGITELTKGYFPHLFNRKENQHLVLDGLPDISYYTPDGMKPDDRVKFLEWYKEHKHDIFDFQQELLTYCRSDVDILRRCCLKFREDFIGVTGLDPFERCITIASAWSSEPIFSNLTPLR